MRAKTLLFAIVILLLAAPAWAVVLPHYNADGYSTRLALKNYNMEGCTFSVPLDRHFEAMVLVAGKITRSLDSWGGEGFDVSSFEVPEGVLAEVEVQDPLGQRFRMDDLGPEVSALTIMDLQTTGDRNSYVFVLAGKAAVTVMATRDGVVIDEVELLVEGASRVQLKQGADGALVIQGWRAFTPPTLIKPFRAFALVSHQPDGEQFTVKGRQ